MNERTTKPAIDEAVAHYEQLFGPPASLTFGADADFSMMEHACSGPPSDAFESAHVFDILQNLRRKLLKAGKTDYHLCN